MKRKYPIDPLLLRPIPPWLFCFLAFAILSFLFAGIPDALGQSLGLIFAAAALVSVIVRLFSRQQKRAGE